MTIDHSVSLQSMSLRRPNDLTLIPYRFLIIVKVQSNHKYKQIGPILCEYCVIRCNLFIVVRYAKCKNLTDV